MWTPFFSPTWQGLNAVLNQILALEAQPGIDCEDINDFKTCSTTQNAANGGNAAYDPALADCFDTSPFDWTKTGAVLDAGCAGFDDAAFDGTSATVTAAADTEVDDTYLYSLISDFTCGGAACAIGGDTIDNLFNVDKTNYCKINAANTCAGTNYCSNDESLTCSCFPEDPVVLAAEAYTTPIMDYFTQGCLETTTENGGTAAPALGDAHLECISKSLATLPAFGPTEARNAVISHIKGQLYANNDFNKLEEIDACFENDAYIKHLAFILNNMSELESKSTPTVDANDAAVPAECAPDFDETVFNNWDFTGAIDWNINDYTTEGLTEAYQEALLTGFTAGNPTLSGETCIALMKNEYALQLNMASEFKGECDTITASGSVILFDCPDQATEDQCTATFGDGFTQETCLGLGCTLSAESDYVETCTGWASVGSWGWEAGPTGYWGYNFFSESLANYCDNSDDAAAGGSDDVVNCGSAAEANAQAGGSDGNTSMSAGRQAEILAGVAAAMASMSTLGGNGEADNQFQSAVQTWFETNDPDNKHVVDKIMSMDNMAWEGFNYLLQAGGAMMDDGGYAGEGGAGGLVGLYDAFSNNGAWDGSWRTGDGNEAAAGENTDTNGWINADNTWWSDTLNGMNWSDDYTNKWNTQEQYDTFYNHTFNRMPAGAGGSGSGSGSGNGNGNGMGFGANSPGGLSFGATSPPGAMASSLDAAGADKVNGDIVDTWIDCLSVTPGITAGFIAIFDATMKAGLTDDGTVLACETGATVLEEKITAAVTAADNGDPAQTFTNMWTAYKDSANTNCPGCWDAQVLRVELQLRAFKQWGEDTSVAGFETLEEFCAFDFNTVVTCTDDGTALTPDALSTRVNGLGLPAGINDAFHESNRVTASTVAPATTAAGTTAAGATTTAVNTATGGFQMVTDPASPTPTAPAPTTVAGAGGGGAAGGNNTPTPAATTAAATTAVGGAGGNNAAGTGGTTGTGGGTGAGLVNAYGMISGDPHIKIHGEGQESVCFEYEPHGKFKYTNGRYKRGLKNVFRNNYLEFDSRSRIQFGGQR